MDWLLVGGWAFFDAGKFYAMVRVSAVENWPRVSTKDIRDKLQDVAIGIFQFTDHEHLLWPKSESDGGANEGEDTEERISETTGTDED